MSTTKDTDKGHSGTQTGLCTMEPGPRDRGMVMVCINMRTGIRTRGTGNKAKDTAKESTHTRTGG